MQQKSRGRQIANVAGWGAGLGLLVGLSITRIPTSFTADRNVDSAIEISIVAFAGAALGVAFMLVGIGLEWLTIRNR